MAMAAKPSVEELGVDTVTVAWRGSGHGAEGIEVAFVHALGDSWVLMRATGGPAGRVLVFNRFEWDCFLDGARKGEFDDAAR